MALSAVPQQGFAKERYQMLRELRPVNSVTAGSLKSAADTVIGKVYVPAAWGSIDLKRLGFYSAAAGGAQTTAGTLKLQINGVDVKDTDNVVFTVASVASHSEGAVVEVDLNKNPLGGPPSWPAAVPGDIITFVVEDQGVGAGDQTVFPYILASETPGQAV